MEWSVYVQNPSTGYPKVSLGKGWYPDALIPFSSIHLDSSKVNRWTYPLWLPDFNNRIENQKSMIVPLLLAPPVLTDNNALAGYTSAFFQQ